MGETMTEATSKPMCPMADMCQGMKDKPTSSLVLFIPALIFVIFGIRVLIAPRDRWRFHSNFVAASDRMVRPGQSGPFRKIPTSAFGRKPPVDKMSLSDRFW